MIRWAGTQSITTHPPSLIHSPTQSNPSLTHLFPPSSIPHPGKPILTFGRHVVVVRRSCHQPTPPLVCFLWLSCACSVPIFFLNAFCVCVCVNDCSESGMPLFPYLLDPSHSSHTPLRPPSQTVFYYLREHFSLKTKWKMFRVAHIW